MAESLPRKMGMTASERLDVCLDGLRRAVQRLPQVATRYSEKRERAEHMGALLSATCTTLIEMRALLTSGQYTEAACLCRSIYENSLRTRWAVCTSQGWERLRRYWCEEDIKRLKELKEVNSAWAVSATRQIAALEREMEKGPQKSAPSIYCIVDELKKNTQIPDHRAFKNQYGLIYRSLCSYSHWNPFAIFHPEQDEKVQMTVFGAAVAASCLLTAAEHEFGLAVPCDLELAPVLDDLWQMPPS